MQLTYRGQTYETQSPAIEISETQETAAFMGQSYARMQYQVDLPQQPPQELTFMGQRYVRTPQSSSLPCKPRPGERRVNGRQLLQLQRSRSGGKHHPAFRGS